MSREVLPMDQMTTDIGSRLQHAREQRGLTLQKIAASTKIPVRALSAIEHSDFDRLPGGVFRRAYLRTFAAAVGLDADEIVREYRARFDPEPSDGPLLQQEGSWRDRLRVPLRLPTTLVAIVGALIVGSLISQQGRIGQEAQEEPGVPSPVEAGPSEGSAQPDDSNAEKGVAYANAAVADITAPALRLEIRTSGPCWVSAVADGERVVYRLMQPGERTLIDARSSITLRVGDAGAVAYSINGASGRPLGRDGETVTVRIDRDSLGSLSADPARAIPGQQTRLLSRLLREAAAAG
jgi:cytoskeleton protein RodZ